MGFSEIMMSLELGLIYGIVGMGVYLTFRVIDFPDLTCDGSFALGLAISGVMIQSDYNAYYVLIISLLGGLIAGAVTGILNAYCKVTDLLAGILVAFMLYSVNVRVMDERTHRTLNDDVAPSVFRLWSDHLMEPIYKLFPSLEILSPYHHVMVLVVLSAIIILFLSWLLNTDLGLSIRAIGQNRRLCKNNGVNVNWMIILGVAAGNGLIALGGALYSQYGSVADITAGVGTIITGFAAVIIGEKVFPFRSIWVKLVSCVVGSILFHLIKAVSLNTELTYINQFIMRSASIFGYELDSHFIRIETYDFNLIAGLVIIIVMMTGRRKC